VFAASIGSLWHGACTISRDLLLYKIVSGKNAYGENISLEDLDTLPLLDMVVKEVYRLNPSIPTTVSSWFEE
jgi:hypothetical protein